MTVGQDGFCLLSPGQMASMREAGRVVGALLAFMRREAREGVSTRELDEAAEEFIRARGAIPAFKGIYGYKYTICASENEKVVHGLPNRRRLQAGDIIGLDMGAIVDGLYADAAISVPVGEVSPEAARLLKVTEESLWRAIPLIRDGVAIGDLGHAVQSHAEAAGFSVVREYVGHGIGDKLHMAPQIPNYGRPGTGVRLVRDMAVAVEPMINVGVPDTKTLPDRWTVVTADRKLSAHFEHTILVGDAPEVLTLEEGRDYAEVGAEPSLVKVVKA
ncbi:MAG: type I methionyl aminopeptidase [Candidatus Sericytochromatia bacterium]|nr:type I methionyl aminopeptidase [Candidatus Sericytochromatia bacterium]